MAQVYQARAGLWRNKSGTLTPPLPPTRPGSHRPATPIFGVSSGTPGPANTAKELDIYRNMSKLQLFDYLQAEFAALAGIQYSAASPLFKAWHNYDNSLPANLASSSVAGAVPRSTVGVLNVHAPNSSLINGSLDARIDSLVASCPKDRSTYLMINHEPENDPGYSETVAAQWRQGVAHFCHRVLATRGTRPVIPGVSLINWMIHPSNHAANYEWDNPAPEMLALGVDLNEVVYATDGYDRSPIAPAEPSNLFTPTSNRARGWGFTRFGLTEVAGKSYKTSSPNDRGVAAAWMRALADLAYTKDFEFVLWFNSGVGAADFAGPEGWWIYGDANKKQWAEICAGVYPA
jgi:hypothetical protein